MLGYKPNWGTKNIQYIKMASNKNVQSINVYNFHKSRIVMENLQDRSRGSKRDNGDNGHNNRPKGFQMSKIRLTTRSGR